MSHAPGIVEIDLDALARNYERVAAAVAPSTAAAVVKADAYGLGVAEVGPRLLAAGCRHFFVATEPEGVALRALLPDATIYVFDGVASDEIGELVAAKLVPVLNTVTDVRRWADTGRPAVLHLDSGMNRLGLDESALTELAAEPGLLERLDIAYVMTHLACGDEPGHALNAEQVRVFDALRARLPAAPTSIGNSAGAFLGAPYCGDLVRPGIALYGGNPFSDRPTPVEPVVRLRGRVLQLRKLDARTTVGYGATFAAESGACIAVLGVGYADGYPRSLSNRGWGSVGGVRVPVVGRVSMDLMCLDVSAVPEGTIDEGAYVELLGHDVPLDDLAAAAGTIGYEMLTSLGPRLERIYRRSESKP